ncbi:MAG: nitroreductase [Desulfococcaceae bacterium]|jgi:nitroreductase|nr:nitroreductase [Desulfococcaceae bacterium]
MNITEAIRKRKSIRNFKKDPVPQEIIREILETACRAPSAMNTQPWEFTVITKAVLDSVRKGILEKFRAGEKPHSEHSVTGWPPDSVYRRRQVELAKQLFHLLDIKREDMDKRTKWLERGFRFFNAPAAIIISADRVLAEGTPVFDIGVLTQTVCLAALHYNLGTCIQDQGVMYPEVLRKYCNIPDSRQIIIAIAIGYPDWDFPANQLETPREPLDKITTWCGFG